MLIVGIFTYNSYRSAHSEWQVPGAVVTTLDDDTESEEEDVSGYMAKSVTKEVVKKRKDTRDSFHENTKSGDNEGGVIGASTAGTTNFNLMHWVSYWECIEVGHHCTVAVSVPSGVFQDSIQGIMIPAVSADGMSLRIKCEWPLVLYNMELLREGFKSEMRGLSLANMVHASNKVALDLRKDNGLDKHHRIGGYCHVVLNIEVERKPVMVVPVECLETNGVVLYIILKKHVTGSADASPHRAVKKIDMGKNKTSLLCDFEAQRDDDGLENCPAFYGKSPHQIMLLKKRMMNQLMRADLFGNTDTGPLFGTTFSKKL